MLKKRYLFLSLCFILCVSRVSPAAGYEWNYPGGYSNYFQLSIDYGTTLNQTGGIIQVGEQGQPWMPEYFEWWEVPQNSQNGGPEWAQVEMPITKHLIPDALFIGTSLPADTQAIYNMRGGELRVYGETIIGVQYGSPGSNSLAQWNIYEGSMVNLQPVMGYMWDLGNPRWRDSEWDWLDGYGQGLSRERRPEWDPIDPNQPIYYLPWEMRMPMHYAANLTIASHGEVNIFGGDINVQGNVQGGYSGRGTLNIYGPHANIYFQNFNTDNLDVNFVPDSYGTSPINGWGWISSPLNVKVDGFLSLKVDSINLLTSQRTSNWYSRALNLELDTTYGGTRLKMAEDTPDWNLLGVYEVFDGIDTQGKVAGSLKVEGTWTPIKAIFTGLAGEKAGSESLASVLCNYLNDTLVETGMTFSLMNDTSLLLTGDYLNDSGWAYFGWDLTAFNSMYGSNVNLYEFNEVPEPATWVLMLLGGATLFVLRRRR